MSKTDKEPSTTPGAVSLASLTRGSIEQLANNFPLTARFMPVIGDSMHPTFPPNSLVAVAPVDSYCGEGVYVLHDGLGPALFRAHVVLGTTDIDVWRDNPAYSGSTWTREQFEGAVLGQVFAHVSILDRGLIPEARISRRPRS
jgi:hypothetical protein